MLEPANMEEMAILSRLMREDVIEIAGPDHLTALACAMRFGELVRRTCIVAQRVIRDMDRVH